MSGYDGEYDRHWECLIPFPEEPVERSAAESLATASYAATVSSNRFTFLNETIKLAVKHDQQ